MRLGSRACPSHRVEHAVEALSLVGWLPPAPGPGPPSPPIWRDRPVLDSRAVSPGRPLLCPLGVGSPREAGTRAGRTSGTCFCLCHCAVTTCTGRPVTEEDRPPRWPCPSSSSGTEPQGSEAAAPADPQWPRGSRRQEPLLFMPGVEAQTTRPGVPARPPLSQREASWLAVVGWPSPREPQGRSPCAWAGPWELRRCPAWCRMSAAGPPMAACPPSPDSTKDPVSPHHQTLRSV